MTYQKYIKLNNKRYKVMDFGQGSFQPIIDRQRVSAEGLTGKTIIQDFTVSNRVPQLWRMTLQVFQTTPWPDSNYGVFSDFLTAYSTAVVDFVEHDDTKTHKVTLEGPVAKTPRVGANIEGSVYGVDWIEITLRKVFE